MNSNKISIITSTYNAESTLEGCILSILSQTYLNIEYIIIDGDSTDGTLGIVKKYENEFNGRLKWISEKDNGIYDAWNKGIALSSGDWITFVGGDDILLADAMDNYIKEINENPGINFISSRVLLVKNNLMPIRVIGQPWSEKMRIFCCIAHVGSLHSRELFNMNGQFDTAFRISGDYDFLLRCLTFIKPYFTPVQTAKIREGGISGRQIFKVASETLKAKTNNNIRSTLMCYLDFVKMIVKYYVRVKILNKILVPTK